MRIHLHLSTCFAGVCLCWASLLWFPNASVAQSTSDLRARVQTPIVTPDSKPTAYFNLAMKTDGGNQFWTDWRNLGGWRIQQNSETDHCRLLDPNHIRRAWGDYAYCNQVLDEAIAAGHAEHPTGKVVILLHGLVRSRKSMIRLQQFLDQQGYTALNFSYASSRREIADHAAALRFLVDGLGPEVTDIYFVAHSLGNLVIRRYLHDAFDKINAQQGDARIRRIVMLGPPNQGSRAARMFKENRIFRSIAGKGGDQLGRDWTQVEPTLATPQMEFGIIAGGQSSDFEGNPLLPGKDDYTVSTSETKLSGAADFLVRPLLHGTMMQAPEVFAATHCFFARGYFISEEARNPIPATLTPSNR